MVLSTKVVGRNVIRVSDHMVNAAAALVNNSTHQEFQVMLVPSLFGRVTAMANLYEQVRLESLSVQFSPLYGTSVPGSIAMYFDYNEPANLPGIVAYADALLATGCVNGPIYKPLRLAWRSQDHGDREFGLPQTSFRTDNKKYAFHLAISVPQNVTANFGYLIFSYTVTFKGLKVLNEVPQQSTENSTFISKTALTFDPSVTGHMSDTIQSLLSPK